MENKKEYYDGAFRGILIGAGLAFSISAIVNNHLQEKQTTPQTRNVIGNPNARDPNDTYIDINGQRFYGTIDGQNTRDYIKNQRK
ncbi:MAG: hypothetical protein KJ592_00695 [Nanoarchaeota archaeon]|nr:hypothetical protein [Nanoarchaeota archaeon]